MNKSVSCPAITAASTNLRKYSLDRKRIADPDRVEKGFHRPKLPQINYEKVDLIGGNGRWRQRKAQEDFDRKEAEDVENRRQQEILEQERRRRQAAREEKRRRHAEEERLRFMQENERRLREQKERDEARRREEEEERLRREKEHQDWLARQPTDCETCKGTGVCPACMGKAFSYETFLVSKVTSNTPMDYGRVKQGCPECGGCRQNILGELVKGSGRCATCGGNGKLWPAVAYDKQQPAFMRHRFTVGSTTLSPTGKSTSAKRNAPAAIANLSSGQSGPLSPMPPSPMP
jgi:hypothetical protein